MDKLFRHILPQTALDIGAHVGNFTKALIGQFPSCKVMMIEANRHCEPFLKEIGLPYEIVALSSFNGEALIYLEDENDIGSGSSLYRENTIWYQKGRKETVKTKMLDSCDYFDGIAIDLIKMDVQGSELDIILGGEKTIKNSKFVLTETSLLEYNQGSPGINTVVEKMVSLDFCIADLVDYKRLSNGTIFQIDILFKNLKKE